MRSKRGSKRRARIKGWRCDSCAGMITSVEGGWVEWLASEDKHGNDIVSGLRLVHRGRRKNAPNHSCRYDPLEEFRSGRTIVEGLPLERLVGADGLMILLSLLAVGELPHHEILELVKRVQIPGYELVRNLPPRGQHLELRSPVLGHGYYLQSEIWEMLDWADQTISTGTLTAHLHRAKVNATFRPSRGPYRLFAESSPSSKRTHSTRPLCGA